MEADQTMLFVAFDLGVHPLIAYVGKQNVCHKSLMQNIKITHPFDLYPLTPHFYIVILADLGSITLKCNALHYNYFQNHCITLQLQ